MCWATLAILLALQVGKILGGEISKFGYSEDSFKSDWGESPAEVLMTTPANHTFSLLLHKYCKDDGSTRNIFEVFYNSYLLERMKAPRYDSISEFAISGSLKESVKPVGPSEDVDQPPTITVRYSIVGDYCEERTYEYKSSAKNYKKSSHKVVYKTNCQ